jgi:LacI family transcriptional regulator
MVAATATERVTLAQVARQAGVTPATASQVLNDRPNCWASEATRSRIVAAATALGYRPNLAARSLRSGRTHTIGMVATALGLAAPRNRVAGLDAAAMQAGYTVMMSFNANSPEWEDRLIRRHLDRGADALVVYPAKEGPHTELRRLVAAGFPLVTLDGAGQLELECDDVSPDYALAGKLQVQHLLELGRCRIAILRPEPSAWINNQREAGALAALADAGQAPQVLRFCRPAVREEPTADDIYLPLRDCLSQHLEQFDALVSYDTPAALAVRALHELGRRIPADVAVIGAGNGLLASHGTFPLSSIDTGDDWIGHQAFGLLAERLAGTRPATAPRRLLVAPRLVVRRSTVATA